MDAPENRGGSAQSGMCYSQVVFVFSPVQAARMFISNDVNMKISRINT